MSGVSFLFRRFCFSSVRICGGVYLSCVYYKRIFDKYVWKASWWRVATVCLVRPGRKKTGFWRKLWRRYHLDLQDVGMDAVCVELPWTEGELYAMDVAARKRCVTDIMRRLRVRGYEIFGWPLDMILSWPGELPEGVIDARELAVRAFVAMVGKNIGGWQNRQVALLGVEERWHRWFVDELLGVGARPVLYGPGAVGLAEKYWRELGVALPVFGVKKIVSSSEVLLVLDPAFADVAEGMGRLHIFREVMVRVKGDFVGRYAFGWFGVGWAAALSAGGAEIFLDKG